MSTDEMRIGTADRDAAMAALQQAVGDGYLSLDEFSERSSMVLAARTRGELRPALGDLPTGQRLVADPPPTVRLPETETIDIDWKTVRRSTGWVVPPRLHITGTTGTADLDLGAATLSHPAGCEILLDVSMSTVKLRLTPQQRIDGSQLQLRTLSAIKDRRRTPAGGGPVITLLGSVSTTTIKVVAAR